MANDPVLAVASSASLFRRDHQPHCVWPCFRFCLSFRDIDEMVARRGITVGCETARQWCLKFAGASARDDRSGRRVGAPGRPGFTLVELLIAIAIVAVLVAIAVPSYGNYRYRAQVAQAQSDIRDLESVIARYYGDNRLLPDSLADIGKAGLLDSWKHPYAYLRLNPLEKKLMGQVRKDKNLVPINSDYDLYSMGRDGTSQAPLTAAPSRDDIVRASNGRFVGLASDY
jgi:general secretion pathway protein G